MSKHQLRFNMNYKGFPIIELVFVIVITAILSTIAITTSLAINKLLARTAKGLVMLLIGAGNLENFVKVSYGFQANSYPLAGIMTNESLINQYLPDI